MPVNFTKLGTEIWRDFNTADTPASGKYSPRKADVRQWAAEVEAFLKTGTVSGLMPSLEVKSATPFVRFTDTDASTDTTCEARVEGTSNGSIKIIADRQNAYAGSEISFEVDGTKRGSVTSNGINATKIGASTPDTGVFTFVTVEGGSLRVTTEDSSRIDLECTDVTDTHQRVRLIRGLSTFKFQVADQDGGNAVDFYSAVVNETGAVSHDFKVNNSTILEVDNSGVDITGSVNVAGNIAITGPFSGSYANFSTPTYTAIDLAVINAPDDNEVARFYKTDNGFGLAFVNKLGTVARQAYSVTDAGVGTGAQDHKFYVGADDQILLFDNTQFAYSCGAAGFRMYDVGAGEAFGRFAASIAYLGWSSNRWETAYLVSAPNVSSDARLKENIRELNEAERRAAAKIKPKTYTMRDSKKRKVGYIAQEIIEAMASEGLDAIEYGLVELGEDGFYGVDYNAVQAFRSA